MAKTHSGICYLTGAGPGDLGLLTLKARSAIETADVILYDSLCNPALLKWAKADAELIFVGKRAGAHALPQEEINALLVDRTKAGKRVVRLKGGDPFLFGRGGEEAEALAEAGLPFEIIPGITSAVAAPAYAGIPITHRDHNAQVTFFTGHEDPTKEGSRVDYKAIASQPGTKVMLMGLERLESVTEKLLAEGAAPELPAAIVQWGTHKRQKTVTGTLSTIAALAKENQLGTPALVIFGEVVTLRKKLLWFENKPLFGKRIVVTRTRKQASGLTDPLEALGAEVIELPTIRIEALPPQQLLEFGQLVQDTHTYDWIVFTSPNGVDAYFDLFYRIFKDAREIGGVRIAAVGPATAERIQRQHFFVDLQADPSTAEGLIKAFQKECTVENLKILIIRPEEARDVLSTELTKLGAIVDEAIAYKTVPDLDSAALAQLKEEGADVITFASSSAVENFLALGIPLPATTKTASIGPITSKTMKALGLRVDIEAKQHDIAGLITALKNSA